MTRRNATRDPKEKWHTDASAVPDTASEVRVV